MSKVKVAASILAADFGRLAEEARAAERAGADWIHVDVMDGHFVPNITLGPQAVSALRGATELPLDVHLMIEEPERYVESFVSAGATSVSVHQEACRHLHRVLEKIRASGAVPAVAINPGTPVSFLESVLDEVGMVLVMSVDPGFGGQEFIASSLRKVERLRELREKSGLRFDIEVDGGVKVGNARALGRAGADVLVCGSEIFSSADYRSVVESLRSEWKRGRRELQKANSVVGKGALRRPRTTIGV
ncbi:MAG: ribulose-phosphate 3-epimerase [Candidatus Binatia bacterium]|nr:MAG: ribulose-phosphate 3-epimerase [Candidatus Binatia bacterium]